jgi:dCTP deaminase
VKQEMPNLTEVVTMDDATPFILHPGEFVLAVTLERVEIPDDLVGRLDGKSSLGRLGLIVHSTAGFVDPGFNGRLTLELTNVANLPVTLYYAMPVSQISFSRLTTPAEKPYGSGATGSKYQGQTGPEPSRYYLNYRQVLPARPHRRRRPPS